GAIHRRVQNHSADPRSTPDARRRAAGGDRTGHCRELVMARPSGAVVVRRAPPAEIDEAHARRAVIERIRPEIDAGRFPIKRTVGETVEVFAQVFADGHDVVTAVLRDRHAPGFGIRDSGFENDSSHIPNPDQIPNPKSQIPAESTQWRETPMTLGAPGTDEWTANFDVCEPGRSEEHTSELQSPYDLVCRLLLEKKNNIM